MGYENCTLLLGEENINHIIFLVSETSFCLQTRAKYPCIHKKVSRYKIKKLVNSMIGFKKNIWQNAFRVSSRLFKKQTCFYEQIWLRPSIWNRICPVSLQWNWPKHTLACNLINRKLNRVFLMAMSDFKLRFNLLCWNYQGKE